MLCQQRTIDRSRKENGEVDNYQSQFLQTLFLWLQTVEWLPVHFHRPGRKKNREIWDITYANYLFGWIWNSRISVFGLRKKWTTSLLYKDRPEGQRSTCKQTAYPERFPQRPQNLFGTV